jgi:hydrogenase maturation factor HypF (carbamoyltransferase family)
MLNDEKQYCNLWMTLNIKQLSGAREGAYKHLCLTDCGNRFDVIEVIDGYYGIKMDAPKICIFCGKKYKNSGGKE